MEKPITTYRQLRDALNKMPDAELDFDLTVESATQTECWPASFQIADDDHDSLENGHPVFVF